MRTRNHYNMYAYHEDAVFSKFFCSSAGQKTIKSGIFSVFPKSLRAQRAGRVAPRRGGAKRRAAALGAAQRRKAPPQAAERRAAHKACFSAFNFAPIIEKQKMLTGRSAGIRPVLWPGQPLGIKLHGQRLKYLRSTKTCLWYSPTRVAGASATVSRQSQQVL